MGAREVTLPPDACIWVGLSLGPPDACILGRFVVGRCVVGRARSDPAPPPTPSQPARCVYLGWFCPRSGIDLIHYLRRKRLQLTDVRWYEMVIRRSPLVLVRSPSRVATKKLQLLRSTGIAEAISLIATVHLLKLQSSLLLKTTGIMRLQIGLRRCRRRPYRVECTGSLSTSEVKQHRAWLVLGWGTAWEDLRVLSAFPQILHNTRSAWQSQIHKR